MKITGEFKQFTGIGSLPHHNVDTALAYSFKMGIPFLPQIPIRNPWEFMISQALEGLPGLQVEDDGNAILNLDVWKSQSHLLTHRLKQAFSEGPSKKGAFAGFEPSPAISSCWQPFLWELQEREIPLAKVQITGPMTAQLALRLKNQESPDRHPELCSQIYELIFARSLALIHRLQLSGIQPVLFLDEPGLYALSLENPRHLVCLQELKILIQSLKKEGAWIGLHCCSNTQWGSVLQLGMDILSIDSKTSLEQALSGKNGEYLKEFIQNGNRLSLGVIPTTRSNVLQSLDPRELARELQATFEKAWGSQPQLIQKVLQESFYTPACGLAFQSVSDSELILDKLVEVYASISPQ